MNSDGYLIEKWIYVFALRHNFKSLLQEHSELFRRYSAPDLDIVLFTIRSIVNGHCFQKFDLLSDLLERLQCELTIFDNFDEFGKLLFMIKFVHILQEIGNSSTDRVVSLMNDYFRSADPPSESRLVDCRKEEFKEFRSNLIEANFGECRKFILNVLIRPDRQQHFKNTKFPQNFMGIIEQIKLIVNNSLDNIRNMLPTCELDQYLSGKSIKCNDPSVMLFCEHILPNCPIDEECLTNFIKNLSSSQISVTPPQIMRHLHTSPEKDDRSSNMHRAATAVAGKELSAENCQSLPTSNAQKNGSNELFPPDSNPSRSL